MRNLLWTGKLSFGCWLLVNANSVLSWIIGSARDRAAMKRRVQSGYDGGSTDHVERYDELGSDHYRRIGDLLLDRVDLRGKRVLDVGCGTGILSFLAIDRGAASVVGGDFAARSIRICEAGASVRGLGDDRVEFRQMDAESLPFADGSFDVVISSMVLGFLPNQPRAVGEMARVTRAGGVVALATHGRAYYWEAVDASIMAARKRYLLGYRFEMWFRSPNEVERMMSRAGLRDVTAGSATWPHDFRSGGDAYDFFAGTTTLWWLGKYPPQARVGESDRVRRYFQRHLVASITSDVVLARGRKA